MDKYRKTHIRLSITKRICQLEHILETGRKISSDSALLLRTQDELKLLHRQLERLDDDDFGLCRDCGVEIAANRIASLPSTELCIACAQQEENKQ